MTKLKAQMPHEYQIAEGSMGVYKSKIKMQISK
jgi:hypothetical protein